MWHKRSRRGSSPRTSTSITVENYTPSATTTSTMSDTPAEADNVRVTGLAALLPPSCAFEELPGDGEIYNLRVEEASRSWQ